MDEVYLKRAADSLERAGKILSGELVDDAERRHQAYQDAGKTNPVAVLIGQWLKEPDRAARALQDAGQALKDAGSELRRAAGS